MSAFESKRITEEDMLRFEFNPRRLRDEGGFDAYQLRICSFNATDLHLGNPFLFFISNLKTN
jgi:hypothetical protein